MGFVNGLFFYICCCLFKLQYCCSFILQQTDAVLGENTWVKEYEEYISKLETFKEKIDKEIIKDFENDGVTKEWVDYHSEELMESIEENGTLDSCDKNLPVDRQILSALKLNRIGI